MNPENNPNLGVNNDIVNNTPVNNIPVNNNVSSIPVSLTEYMQSPPPNVNTIQNDNVTTEVPAAPVPPMSVQENNSGETTDNKSLEEHDVTRIIGVADKEKVNLLTPEQKAELIRKREEAMREKENYQAVPVSKFKRFMSFVLLIGLMAVVLFLPEINEVYLQFTGEKKPVDTGTITTGTLECTNDRIDDKYNISYTYDFDFTDNKLKKLSYYEATTGDELVDADDLSIKLSNCENLKSMVNGMSGIKVSCSLSSGTLTRTQIFDYTVLNTEQVSTAYMEAGGEYPGEYQKDSDIDSIERNMKSYGYSCDRYK